MLKDLVSLLQHVKIHVQKKYLHLYLAAVNHNWQDVQQCKMFFLVTTRMTSFKGEDEESLSRSKKSACHVMKMRDYPSLFRSFLYHSSSTHPSFLWRQNFLWGTFFDFFKGSHYTSLLPSRNFSPFISNLLW